MYLYQKGKLMYDAFKRICDLLEQENNKDQLDDIRIVAEYGKWLWTDSDKDIRTPFLDGLYDLTNKGD